MGEGGREPLGLTRRDFLRASGATLITTSVTGCDLLSTKPSQNGGQEEQNGAVGNAKEAPMLAELVRRRELPPLQERLPKSPVIVEPLNMLGEYGGTLRGTTLAPETTSDLQTTMVPGLFRFSHDLENREPEIAESFELSNDYRECEIKLREGIKWSDSEPFTADDVIFYFEDWQFDKDLSPVPALQWIQGGEPMRVSAVDKYTVRFEFAAPNPSFALLHYSAAPAEPYSPRHFLERYHARYNPAAEEEATAEGYENWQDRFLTYATVHYGEQAPETPVLDPWRPVENNQQRQRYERNPYYWKVDSEGRQLPYIDEVIVEYISDIEVANLRVVSGNTSVAGLDLLLSNYPVFKRGEQDGNFRAFLATSERGADIAIALNQEHKDPALKKIFTDVRFRQALSVAIDREEINDLVFLQQSTPRQATINEQASFYKKEWAEHFAQFDSDLADKLLDEVGLSKRGQDGIRLRPDGKLMSFQLDFLPHEGPKTDAAELVVEYWSRVGLDVSAIARERNFILTRLQAGEHDASLWQVDRQLERASYTYGAPNSKLGPGGNSAITYAQAWLDWFSSGGESGVEPPEEAKQLEEAFSEWQRSPIGTPEYEQAAIRVHDLIAENLWVIGIVGKEPKPIVVKNDLENVFTKEVFNGEEQIWWGAANWYWHPHRAEQWFFRS